MTPKQEREEIEFEDKCGVNTLLQNLINSTIQNRALVYMKVNSKGENCGYAIRKDIQL